MLVVPSGGPTLGRRDRRGTGLQGSSRSLTTPLSTLATPVFPIETRTAPDWSSGQGCPVDGKSLVRLHSSPGASTRPRGRKWRRGQSGGLRLTGPSRDGGRDKRGRVGPGADSVTGPRTTLTWPWSCPRADGGRVGRFDRVTLDCPSSGVTVRTVVGIGKDTTSLPLTPSRSGLLDWLVTGPEDWGFRHGDPFLFFLHLRKMSR